MFKPVIYKQEIAFTFFCKVKRKWPARLSLRLHLQLHLHLICSAGFWLLCWLWCSCTAVSSPLSTSDWRYLSLWPSFCHNPGVDCVSCFIFKCIFSYLVSLPVSVFSRLAKLWQTQIEMILSSCDWQAREGFHLVSDDLNQSICHHCRCLHYALLAQKCTSYRQSMMQTLTKKRRYSYKKSGKLLTHVWSRWRVIPGEFFVTHRVEYYLKCKN